MIYDDEIVVYPDMSKSEEEIQKQLAENEAAKVRHSLRREEERCATPNTIDHIINCILKTKRFLNNVHLSSFRQKTK